MKRGPPYARRLMGAPVGANSFAQGLRSSPVPSSTVGPPGRSEFIRERAAQRSRRDLKGRTYGPLGD